MQKAGSINIDEILKKYPSFKYNSEKRIINGYFYLSKTDSYNLEIHLRDFPNEFPKVYEKDERIPEKADRHINGDGSLCFTTKANESIFLKTQIQTLLDFSIYILKPYLQNNSFYEINKKYAYGEYEHNIIVATYQTYVDLLEVYDYKQLIIILNDRATQKKYRPNDLCYCGSGLKIKNCKDHENRYRKLKKINQNILKADLTLLYNILIKKNG